MACTKCKRRSKLMSRTFQRLVSNRPDGSTTTTTVKSSQCKISTKITASGYVASCATCNSTGNPSPVPETATLECKGTENDTK